MQLHQCSPEYARSASVSANARSVRLPLDGRPAATGARSPSERRSVRALGGVRLARRAEPRRAHTGARGLLRDPRGSRLRRRRRRSDRRRPRRDLRVRSSRRHGARRDPHAAGESRADASSRLLSPRSSKPAGVPVAADRGRARPTPKAETSSGSTRQRSSPAAATARALPESTQSRRRYRTWRR